MVKIYGSKMSSAMRCYWLLEEIGLEYETVELNMREKEHKGEAFLQLNPNGKIPALSDGDFVLWESMAINRYLAVKYKPELLGSSIEHQGLIDQWTFWSIVDLSPPLLEIFFESKFRNNNQDVIKAEIEKTHPYMELLNNYLESKDYMVGNIFTLADINVGSVIGMAINLEYDMTKFPHIMKWAQIMMQRPSFQKLQLG